MLPDFKIESKGTVSEAFLAKGITSFNDACQYVKRLPYSRNTDKTDLAIILKENCGTCSSKHAALAQLSVENNQTNINLMIGIYKMTEANTKGVGNVLTKHNLSFMPEAHNYLMYHGKRYDFTGLSGNESPMDSLVQEYTITPSQITDHKVKLHQDYIQEMLSKGELKTHLNLNKLWQVREECIKALS